MTRYLLIAIAALMLTTGVQTHRIHRLKADLVTATKALDDAMKAAKDSEDLREIEGKAASESYTNLSETCAAGMANSLKRGRLIERIVNAPANPDGSRGAVGADSLRALMGQAEPEAAALSK